MATVIHLVQIEPKNGFETEKWRTGIDSVDIYPSPPRLVTAMLRFSKNIRRTTNNKTLSDSPLRCSCTSDFFWKSLSDFCLIPGDHTRVDYNIWSKNKKEWHQKTEDEGQPTNFVDCFYPLKTGLPLKLNMYNPYWSASGHSFFSGAVPQRQSTPMVYF